MAATTWLGLLHSNWGLQVQVFQDADKAGLCWPSISGPGNITSTAFYWLKEAHPDTKHWEADSSISGEVCQGHITEEQSTEATFGEYSLPRCHHGGGGRGTNPLTHPTLKLIRLSTSVFYDNSLPFKPIRIAVFATFSKSILTETNSY